MESYERFAQFYDAVMGDRKESTDRSIGFVDVYNPKAKTVMELACGTGSVLKHLQKRYQIYGLDLSKQMLGMLSPSFLGVTALMLCIRARL
jgi:ubiquinone/menaquinone biosynthesis C-methylase UbiE